METLYTVFTLYLSALWSHSWLLLVLYQVRWRFCLLISLPQIRLFRARVIEADYSLAPGHQLIQEAGRVEDRNGRDGRIVVLCTEGSYVSDYAIFLPLGFTPPRTMVLCARSDPKASQSHPAVPPALLHPAICPARYEFVALRFSLFGTSATYSRLSTGCTTII
jgi:hypothetical protein